MIAKLKFGLLVKEIRFFGKIGFLTKKRYWHRAIHPTSPIYVGFPALSKTAALLSNPPYPTERKGKKGIMVGFATAKPTLHNLFYAHSS